MRYVPIKYIREGMILGKTLYGDNAEVLLRREAPIFLLKYQLIQSVPV